MAAVLVKGSILKLFQSRQLKLFAFKVAKFRTGKICPEIAFTICTKQFHLMKNGHEGLKLMVLKKWNQSFRLEHFFWKNKTIFSDVPLLQAEIFRWSDPKSREFRLLYNQIFRKYLCKKTGEYIKTGQAYRLKFLHSAELAVAGGPSFQFHMYRSRTQMDRFGCQRASLRDLVGRKLSKWSYR